MWSFLTSFYYNPLYNYNVMNKQQQSNEAINSRAQPPPEVQHEIIALLISHNFMTPAKSLLETSAAGNAACPPWSLSSAAGSHLETPTCASGAAATTARTEPQKQKVLPVPGP